MSDTYLIPFIIVAFLVVFPLMWFGIVFLIMKIAGMSRLVDTSPIGRPVGTVGTGSARIRGMNFSNCLTVDRHEHGYLLRLWKIFGGGKLVIPDDEIIAISEGRAFIGTTVVMELRDGRRIRFFGQLAKNLVL